MSLNDALGHTEPSEGDLTPRPGTNGQERSNPFNDRTSGNTSSPTASGVLNKTVHHLLSKRGPGTTVGGTMLAPEPRFSSSNSDSKALPSPFLSRIPAQPTTQVSLLNAPQIHMTDPPAVKSRPKAFVSTAPTAQTNGSTTANSGPHPAGPSLGLLHITLVEARNLVAKSPYSKPYVVVQYDQNEFVGSNPLTTNIANGHDTSNGTTSTSSAVTALTAIGSRASLEKTSSAASLTHKASTSSGDSYFDTLTSANHPTWKIQVSLYVATIHFRSDMPNSCP